MDEYLYTGHHEMYVDIDQIGQFYEKGELPVDENKKINCLSESVNYYER